LAAIKAHDEHFEPPADDALLSGHEWAERYLNWLAKTDLIADHLRMRTSVVAVGKEELLRPDLPGHEDRGDWSFRILSRDQTGTERVDLFDGVLDCTGTFAQPNWVGHGGVPAVGESQLRSRIEYRLPDIVGRDRSRYAGKHVLLVGAGSSAATNVVALAELAQLEAGTKITWITRREGPAAAGGPVAVIENDQLQQRGSLARRANQLAAGGEPVTYWPRTIVERVTEKSSPAGNQNFEAELSGEHAGIIQVDEIIANVGFRPDPSFYHELQVEEHPAWQGPVRLGGWLDQQRSDCLTQQSGGPQSLINPEPNFYILGAKSYGRRSNFLFQIGLEQIRDVFKLIGDRPTLDLYQGATRLL
jgi:hypothetical protein